MLCVRGVLEGWGGEWEYDELIEMLYVLRNFLVIAATTKSASILRIYTSAFTSFTAAVFAFARAGVDVLLADEDVVVVVFFVVDDVVVFIVDVVVFVLVAAVVLVVDLLVLVLVDDAGLLLVLVLVLVDDTAVLVLLLLEELATTSYCK